MAVCLCLAERRVSLQKFRYLRPRHGSRVRVALRDLPQGVYVGKQFDKLRLGERGGGPQFGGNKLAFVPVPVANAITYVVCWLIGTIGTTFAAMYRAYKACVSVVIY